MLHPFPLYNVTLCNFCEVFKDIIKDYHDLYDSYGLVKFDIDAKKLLQHCIIKRCCDIALSIPTGKVVFYYSSKCLQVSDPNDGPVLRETHKIIKSAVHNLPITWYCSSQPLDYYLKIISAHQGTSFLVEVSNNSKDTYTFSRALKYIQKSKLTFLNDRYFNDLKTRCLLLNT